MSLQEVVAVTILVSLVVLGLIKKDSWYGELLSLIQWWSVIYLCISVLG